MKRTDTGTALALDILAYIEKHPRRTLNYEYLAANLKTERALVADAIRWLQREGLLSKDQPFEIHPDARARLGRVGANPAGALGAPAALASRSLITDELELREYDALAASCDRLRSASMDSAARRSVHATVWQRYDAYRRAADMTEPPPELAYVGQAAWEEFRRKAVGAREAYAELLAVIAP